MKSHYLTAVLLCAAISQPPCKAKNEAAICVAENGCAICVAENGRSSGRIAQTALQEANPTEEYLRNAAQICGASSAEELSPEVADAFSRLLSHPLRINGASVFELASSLLFSDYQASSIEDYISRNGDILSLAELAAVDGIGTRYALLLEPFVSFDPRGRKDGRPKGSGRAALKVKNGTVTGTLKGEASWKGLGASAAYKAGTLRSVNLSYEGRRVPWKIVVGDFNARYGQGLLCWSGFRMTSLATPSAFSLNGSGISPSHSVSMGSSLRGAAGEWRGGRYALSCFATLDGRQLLSLRRMGLKSSLGASLMHAKGHPLSLSADWRATLGRFTLFGEIASIEGTTALRSGAYYNIAYLRRAAILLELRPESATAALGYEQNGFSVTSRLVHTPGSNSLKSIMLYTKKCSLREGITLTPTIRVASSLTAKSRRSELRTAADLSYDALFARLRLDLVHSEGSGVLFLGEVGYREGKRAAYLRGTLFRSEKWAQRVYVYERDSPGNFNMAVYYGRGCAMSLYCRYRAFSFRLSATVYHDFAKPSRYEAGIQADI